MFTKSNRVLIKALGPATALGCCVLAAQTAMGGEFTYLANPDDGVGFETRWNNPVHWSLASGADDLADGIPTGIDTFTMDRSVATGGNTRLSNEGMPDHSVAKITATAGPGRDIVLKQSANVSIGDLEILASADAFYIQEERDQPLEITGVISGPGDLTLDRNGGFSNGVQRIDPNTGEAELISITGNAPNTLTGAVRLFASSTAGNSVGPTGEPGYFVADKVGAFGEASSLTIEGTDNFFGSMERNSGIAELQLTANTTGGEGAIDDDATEVYLGVFSSFNVDAGVNEVIGSGMLFLDLLGSGTYSTVADGTYDNTEDWIIGDGTITVGSVVILPGDTDGDGDIDDSDLGTSFSNYTGPVGAAGGKTAAQGDTDGDGDVDDSDLGTSFSGYTGPLGPASVPEPTSLALLGLGGLALIRRRRA